MAESECSSALAEAIHCNALLTVGGTLVPVWYISGANVAVEANYWHCKMCCVVLQLDDSHHFTVDIMQPGSKRKCLESIKFKVIFVTIF